jgi:glycosyltransferase involved in cell wall biosynthesis
MAVQIPLVVSDIEAHRSVLGDSPYVTYAKKVNPEDLYEALKLTIDKISELKKNASTARDEVIKEHTWKRKAEILSDFLVSIKNKNTKEMR